MNIKPVTRLKNTIKEYTVKKFDKNIKKYMEIHDVYHINDDTLRQIYDSESTLVNYARNKNIKINIYKGDHVLGDMTSASEENRVANKLFVTVTDLANSREKQALIPENPYKIYLNEKTGYRIYETTDDTQFARKYIVESFEDTFLRNLYRTISNMVKDLKAKI